MSIFGDIKSSSKPLITYRDETITYEGFFHRIEALEEKFQNFKNIDDFVVLNEQNPIYFYILLSTLLKNNKKVIFPNRYFFDGYNFKYAKFYVNFNAITLNNEYFPILLTEGDTVLFSSGSTGKPKGIVHDHKSLTKNAECVVRMMNVSNIVSVTPLKPYLVSALSHFFVHFYTESHLIFVDVDNLEVIKEISNHHNNLSYVGSPMHIVSMLPYIGNNSPELFFSSGDIFYTSLLKELFEIFPKTRFFNVYGMAEVGGRLFVNEMNSSSSQEQYKHIGNNLDTIEFKIIDGEVHISSDLLFKGYIIEDTFQKRLDDFFGTGDCVVSKNGTTEFYGRKNDEIKIAGNKVSLKYLEQKISNVLPNCYTPIVISQKHDIFGNILALILYSEESVKVSRANIITRLREELDSHEIPHKIYLTNSLQYTQTMKIDRKALVENIENLEPLK